MSMRCSASWSFCFLCFSRDDFIFESFFRKVDVFEMVSLSHIEAVMLGAITEPVWSSFALPRLVLRLSITPCILAVSILAVMRTGCLVPPASLDFYTELSYSFSLIHGATDASDDSDKTQPFGVSTYWNCCYSFSSFSLLIFSSIVMIISFSCSTSGYAATVVSSYSFSSFFLRATCLKISSFKTIGFSGN